MKKVQFTALLTCLLSVLAGNAGFHSLLIADESTARENRLAQENSPYLLLHAHNPVDWHPWGPEALEKARAEDKPIFLSVGYSSCYWCHVMERKVFSNEEIAAYLNEHFVCIKVDREERPDVDDIYMTSLLVYQQLRGGRGSGGWPLSMFLTPTGEPIAGATYLPPDDQPDGRTGFLTAARSISRAWSSHRAELERVSRLISGEVQRLSLPAASEAPGQLDASVVTGAVEAVTSLYDKEWGGVDLSDGNQQGPRFPNVPRLLLLTSVIEDSQADGLDESTESLLEIVRNSFTQIARGGIRDHLAGGFHRYSTDRRWRVPHFEKMLYDQAQMLEGYVAAARLTGDPLFREVAIEIADFVRNEFTLDNGAFCSALDAETNAVEGEYYVWQAEEIDRLLSAEDAALFKTVYGVDSSNTFEHGHILYLPRSLEEVSREHDVKLSDLTAKLSELRQTLLAARAERERPMLDDKVLTSWNAMMIRSLAMSGREFNRPEDIAAAEKAARFVLQHLRSDDGELLRSWRNNEATHSAYLDDYAFLVSSLIALYDATGNDIWMTEARELNSVQLSQFYDESKRVFYFTAHDHEQLIARTSSPFDSVFPSGNSVAVRNLIRLSEGSEDLSNTAQKTLLRFLPVMKSSPSSSSGLAIAVHEWLMAAASGAANEPSSDETSSTARPLQRRVMLVSAPAEEEEAEKPAESQTVFKPVLDPKAQPGKSNKRVKVNIYPLYNKLPRGKPAPVAIQLTVQKGWHINANPSNPDFLIATDVKFSSKQNVTMLRTKYPKHKLHRMQQEPDPYHVYDGKVMIFCLLAVDPKEKSEKAALQFKIRYQACDNEQCEQPVTVSMTGAVPLAAVGEKLNEVNREKFKELFDQAQKPGFKRQ